MMADPRRALVVKALLEVVLISTGVFIGLAAEQWRSNAQHRDQARDALQRFKIEIEANKAAVEQVKDYHVRVRQEIAGFLDPKTRRTTNLNMPRGWLPARLEHTAWELALATQALADIDSGPAFELARIYGLQRQYLSLTEGMTHAMYLRPLSEDLTAYLHSVKVYYDDIVGLEPALLESYGRVLPLIDRALKD
jgi:hypothetical protein